MSLRDTATCTECSHTQDFDVMNPRKCELCGCARMTIERRDDYAIRKMKEWVKCPKCGGEMAPVPKDDFRDWFLGCKKYPACRGARPMPGKRSETISRRRREFVEDMERQPSLRKWYSEAEA